MRAVEQIGFAATFIGLLGLAGSAGAVDLVNRDRVDRETVVNRSDGQSEVMTLKPGQRIANICTACVILAGESAVEVGGRVTVTIEGGKVTAPK
jgi:hypothetical protein